MFTHYVAGFAFSKDASKVVLIRKNRPKWQAGLLNAVGGHVEEGEAPLWAMRREYQEETGVCNALEDWTLFATLQGGTVGDNYMVNFYYSTLCGCVKYTEVVFPFHRITRVLISYPTPVTDIPIERSTTYSYRNFVLENIDNGERMAYYVEMPQ